MSQAAEQAGGVEAGVLIAHYRVGPRIGAGAMGIVYRAEDTRLRRTVALKVLHPEIAEKPDRRKRFLREGRLAASVTHPCIATVFEAGEDAGRVYIAMELVEGDLLSSVLKAGQMPYGEVLRIAREIARGLVKAHEAGVIHRDLKPDNVLIGKDGIVKLLDFGVAKPVETANADFTDIKTQHGALVGTPAYMSPEQAAGRSVDARSDIFSLGVLFYEMLCRKRPFTGATWQELIISINRDPVKPVSSHRKDVPLDVDHLLTKCLAKSPLDRYRKCRDLLEDLELLLASTALGDKTKSSVISGPTGLEVGGSSTLASDVGAKRSKRMVWYLIAALAVGVPVGYGILSLAASTPPAPAAPTATVATQVPVPTVATEPPLASATETASPSASVASAPSASAAATAQAKPSTPPRGTSAPTATAAAPPRLPPTSEATAKPQNPILGF